MSTNRTSSHAAQRLAKAGTLHLVLLAVSMAMVLPFVWMVLTSLKPLAEVGLPDWMPSALRWSNYMEVFRIEGITVGRWLWNSFFVACWVTFLQVITSTMAAYGFSRIRWKYREKLFVLYLATMMLPGIVMMVPNYQAMTYLRMVDSYAGLIVPAAFSAFGTFLLRQFMLTIPSSLDEAAEIDGANKWQIFWEIIVPLSSPGLITLTIFTFIGNYQSFFWPLVLLRSSHRYTLPVGLLYFDSSQGQQTNLLMAAVTISIIPMLLLFFFLQRYLIEGAKIGAVKA